MARVDELIDNADALMDRAEEVMESDFEQGRQLFREAVSHLERAYLITVAADSVVPGDLPVDVAALFELCLQVEPDFETIQAEIDLLAGTADAANGEMIIDAVNEIWDFMYGLMEEPE